MNILTLLNQNIDVPFEKWPSSLRQLEELASAIRAHRGPQAPASSCVVIDGHALPPRDGDNAGLVTHIRYKVSGTTESHNLH